MLNKLTLCFCFVHRNAESEDEDEHSNNENHPKAPRNDTIFYSAQQSFVPLLLSSDASLDDEATMIATLVEDDQNEQNQQQQGQNDLVSNSSSNRVVAATSKGKPRASIVNTLIFRRQLENKDKEQIIKVLDLPDGYPGHLTKQQLEVCIAFRKKIKEMESTHPLHKEMVYYFVHVEGEAYAICRFLRARKFNMDETLTLIEERVDIWKEGRVHGFFPSASGAIGGAPESAFLTQFPLVLGELAKNGCPVCYFPVEQINIDGVECVCTLEDLPNYIWHFAVHKCQRLIAAVQEKDPTQFIRMQIILLVDLKGLSIGTLKRAMAPLERAMKILSTFPEFLFSVCVINTPRFFGAFWPLITAFMDPASAKKFELYSSPTNGTKRLLELVDAKSLASDFGGSASPTGEIIARQGEGSESTNTIARQVSHLVIKKRNKDVESPVFHLEANEVASVNVHTKADDGAKVVLYKDKNEEIKTVSMDRNHGGENEKDGKPFFRNLSTSLRGPGAFHMVVKRQPNPSTDHFLMTADISNVDK